jgi:signal transduction histidine kinase
VAGEPVAATPSARRRPSRRPRGLSVRLRTTLAAALVVGIFLTVGSVVFVQLVEDSFVGNIASTAGRDAASTVSLLEGSGETRLPEIGDAMLQLYAADGTRVETSPDAEDLALPHVDEATRALIDGVDYIVVAEPAEIAGTAYDLRLALRIGEALDATDTVSGLLAVAVPILLILLAAIVWLLVGRALRPVDTIRREVDAIGPAELHLRVEEPRVDDEVSRLARTMNRMLARLESSAAAQRRFVSDASHELKSPLASIRQHAELAHSYPDRIDVHELAAVVLEEGARLQDVVESLLLLTRLDEGAAALRREPVDLDDLVIEDARRVREVGAIHVDTSGVVPGRVVGDERMLARAVRNLTDNAVRHAKSQVAIAVVGTAGRIEVRVDDDGGGIPAEDRARVLERFVRLDDGRARDSGGSGLGLAIVAEIVRAHDGELRIEDAPLGGARFVIDLPAAAEEIFS